MSASTKPSYLLAFYVPTESSEPVLEAIFSTGAGRIGDYDRCCWKTEGTGQFRPLSGSNPTIGEHDQVEFVSELKVELVCSEEHIDAAISALKKAHPYEEPAYHLIPIRT